MSKSVAPLSDQAKERLQAKFDMKDRLKRQEERLVRRQHRREEIPANKVVYLLSACAKQGGRELADEEE